jgi:UDP-N-acetylmuramoyl-L-alanyl-D-glutamate--2,6-diaminopimelate ligase
MQELHTPMQAAQWLQSRVRGTLHTDSRKVAAGDAFIAWPGAAVDGRRFAQTALQQGATACLVERDGVELSALSGEGFASYAGLKADSGVIAAEFYGHPSKALSVVAVTGTNGKTSTAWWLAQALANLPEGQAQTCGMVGTLGVGIPPKVVSTGLTTPDPVLLQQTLRKFVDAGVKVCAIEASSIGVVEHRLAGVDVQVAVFTNFTQDHLDYHGSMTAYWDAKRRLFNWPGLRSAVVNLDDVQGALLATELTVTPLDVWTVSCREPARLQACNVQYEEHGLRFDVVEGDQSSALHSHMIGAYNVSNLLGVVAAMRALGVPLVSAVQACQTLRPVPGRMECVGGDQQPLVAVDYAHTPDALEQALLALRPLATQRQGALWCVFGCGGDRDASKRPLMGAIAAKNADKVVVTSDNPRSEKPESIIAQILLGLPQSDAVEVQSDRALAIAQTVHHADAKDVILLAGKGHEATQEFADHKTDFSDRAHAVSALRARANPAEAFV